MTAVRARFGPIESLTLALLCLGILLRVVMLDADPYYYEWVGYMTDEGRWIHYARSLALFDGIVRHGLYDLHFLVSPLFQAVTYAVFQIVGVTTASSRLFSAVCGSALLLLFWSRLRHVVSAPALFVGVTILALQVDFVALSRLAIPEMAMLFFEVLAFFALNALMVKQPRRLWLVGIVMAVAFGMKSTAVISLGLFCAMVLLIPPAGRHWIPDRRKWSALGWLLAGFVVPLLVPMVIALGSRMGDRTVGAQGPSTIGSLMLVLQLIRFEDLYGIVGFPFNNPLATTLNYLTLGLWVAWLGWIAREHDARDQQPIQYLATAAIWVVGYLTVMLVLDYFPQRYRVQIVMPMAIAITVGIDLIQRAGLGSVVQALRRRSRWRAGRLVLLALPTAVLLAPVASLVLSNLGVDTDTLRVRMVCVIAVAAIVSVALIRIEPSPRAVGFLVLFPLTEAAVWLGLSVNNWTHRPFWLSGADWEGTLVLFASLAIASGVTVLMIRREQQPGPSTMQLAVGLYVVGYLALSTGRLLPGYLAPRYTIRDTSRDLALLLGDARSVVVNRSEGIFNDNRLRYRAWRGWGEAPEVIVSISYDPNEPNPVDQTYHLIKTYRTFVAPEYLEIHGLTGPPEIRIYKRDQPIQ